MVWCQAVELAELAETHAATWAAITTTSSNVALLTFGLSLCLGAMEMVYRWIFHGMILYLFITGTIAVCFTLYHMQIRKNLTVEEHIKQIDVYVWGVFVCVPVSVTGFFICLTLGLDADPLEEVGPLVRVHLLAAPGVKRRCSQGSREWTARPGAPS